MPNLWGGGVGRPGIMKTPAMQEALKPLNRLVADAREEHRAAMSEHEFRAAEDDARRKVLMRKLKEAVERGDPTDALRDEFARAGYAPPVERRYLVNDATVEKLGELLCQNPNGLLLFRDELPGLLRTMERDGHENDRAFLCEAWSGTGAYTYDRIGRGTVHIPAACLSLYGGIQPGPLHRYLREVFGEGADDDGLIQRFQLLVYPDVGREWRNVDRWPDTEAKSRAFEIFQRLARLDLEALAVHQPFPEDLPFLRFNQDAQAVFDAWRPNLEHRIRAEDVPAVVISHLAKYRSLMPSLALLFHLVDCVERGTGGPVSAAAAERAVAWCAYLEPHARRVYESVTDGARLGAAVLAARLRAGALPSPFRARDVRLKGWSYLTDPKEIVAALDLLEGLHWVRCVKVSPEGGGRPTFEYCTNPAVGQASR